MSKIMFIWVVAASFLAGLRAAAPVTPVAPGIGQFVQALPYLMIVAAPVGAMILAMSWFPANRLYAQPEIRLARFGNWQPVDCLSSRRMPMFGATGIMASLLIGILLNIPVRSVEFMIAMPALGGEAPVWFRTLFAAMLADVIVMSSLYAVAFVMALRHVPWFPRFLLLVWVLDVLSQLFIAQTVVASTDLPANVAGQLHNLLEGNLKKVLISVALWLPYLLVSERVNLTYRQRVPA
ncbi:DUF2569 domain-containing protein [Aquisediminimonas profunda]|uniref:DUF2569 domain-containing protein n=1 Tax=Aquisediminimonas profunda TaxID=1550733 RepID=UPI001FE7AA59|nr:DUF2569 domain-containing protein [Aquisediminimonas profunda]